MIFVTVGTHDQGFNRLVSAMDRVAQEIDEPIKIQRGCSTYKPIHAQSFQFVTSSEIAQLYDEARVVVSHAAAGSIILGLQKARPLVVVPRQEAHNEHMDDHQFQLARAIDEQHRAVAVYEPQVAALRAAIEQAASRHQSQQQSETGGQKQLVDAIKHQIGQWKWAHTQKDENDEWSTI